MALIKNAVSPRMGRKDIIKIDADIHVDLDIIGYIAPNVTINIIRDGKRQEKKTIGLPSLLCGVIRCKNPRCITSTEQELPSASSSPTVKTGSTAVSTAKQRLPPRSECPRRFQ